MNERIDINLNLDINSLNEIRTNFSSENQDISEIEIFQDKNIKSNSDEIEISTNQNLEQKNNEYEKIAFNLGLKGEQAEAYAKMLEENDKNISLLKENQKDSQKHNLSFDDKKNKEPDNKKEFIPQNESLPKKDIKVESDEKTNNISQKENNKKAEEKKDMEARIKSAKEIAKQIRKEQVIFYETVIKQDETKLANINKELQTVTEQKPKETDYKYKDMYEAKMKIWEKKKEKLEETKKKLEKNIKESKENINNLKEKKKKNVFSSFISKITFGLIK